MQTQYKTILDANLPTHSVMGLRAFGRKVWAAEVRKMFKELGIKGVSVTAPNYSMASMIDIRLPKVTECNYDTLTVEQQYGDLPHNQLCPACLERWTAEQKIEAILALAFPDLNDRSDGQSDYFDRCFSFN